MKFLARKQFGTLRPIDEAGEDALRKIKNGATIQVEIKQPRNVKFLRLYWALIGLVWDNLDHAVYPTPENLSDRLKIALGVCTHFRLKDGTEGYQAGSIAFAKMNEAAFSAFYDRVADKLASEWLPGVTSEELKREVESMIGVAA